MNEFLKLAFLFFMGCILGWGLEVLYRHYSPANKTHRWINPGFLVGPYLPLYGCGLCALYLLASLENTSLIAEVTYGSKLLLFLVMAIVMTLLEYIAGLIFIKGMKVKLWDYTNEKFNLQGIICLRFSVYWAILGAVYYFLIHPHILNALEWFSHNLAFSFVVGMFYGVFFVDLAYSLQLVAKVRAFAKEHEVLIRYEMLRQQIRDNAEEHKEKIHWFFSLKSGITLREHLSRYLELERTLNPTMNLHQARKEVREQVCREAEKLKNERTDK